MPSKWKAFTVPSALIYFMTHSCHSRKEGSKENGIYRVPGCHKKIKQENRQGLPEVYHQLHRDLVKSCHPTTHRHCWSFIMSWLRDWHVLWKNWVSCFHGDDNIRKDDKMMTQSKDDGKVDTLFCAWLEMAQNDFKMVSIKDFLPTPNWMVVYMSQSHYILPKLKISNWPSLLCVFCFTTLPTS